MPLTFVYQKTNMLSILLIITIYVSTTIANVNNAHPSTHPPAAIDRNHNLRSGREVLLQTTADTHVSTKDAPTGPPCFGSEQPYDAAAAIDGPEIDGSYSSVSWFTHLKLQAGDLLDDAFTSPILEVDTRGDPLYSAGPGGDNYELTPVEKEHLILAVKGMLLAYEVGHPIEGPDEEDYSLTQHEKRIQIDHVPKGHELIKHVESKSSWYKSQSSIKVSMNPTTGQCLIMVRGTDSINDIVDDLMGAIPEDAPSIGPGIVVPKGFKAHFDDATKELEDILKKVAKKKFHKECDPETTIGKTTREFF